MFYACAESMLPNASLQEIGRGTSFFYRKILAKFYIDCYNIFHKATISDKFVNLEWQNECGLRFYYHLIKNGNEED